MFKTLIHFLLVCLLFLLMFPQLIVMYNTEILSLVGAATSIIFVATKKLS